MLKTLMLGIVVAVMVLIPQVAACSQTEEFLYLRAALYSEANRNDNGQIGVTAIIFNRVESGQYRSTICGVITQKDQFSYDFTERPRDKKWILADKNAELFLAAYRAGRLDEISPLFAVLKGRFEFRSYKDHASDIEVAGNYFRDPAAYRHRHQ